MAAWPPAPPLPRPAHSAVLGALWAALLCLVALHAASAALPQPTTLLHARAVAAATAAGGTGAPLGGRGPHRPPSRSPAIGIALPRRPPGTVPPSIAPATGYAAVGVLGLAALPALLALLARLPRQSRQLTALCAVPLHDGDGYADAPRQGRRALLAAAAAAAVGNPWLPRPATAQGPPGPTSASARLPALAYSGDAPAGSAPSPPLEVAAPPSDPTAATAGTSPGLNAQLQSAARGMAGGATVSIAKKVILFPLDTIRCRLEVARTPRVLTDPELYRDLYAGIVPNLLAGTPASSVFFGSKTLASDVLRSDVGLDNKQLVTVLAVGGALIPTWLVKTPSEVLKTRRQAGTAEDSVAEIGRVVREGGVGALYVGYGANLLYAFPADVVKFLVYDTIKASLHPGIPLSPVESAVFGGVAGMTAALVTTPLDVIRTRLMAEADQRRYSSALDCAVKTVREDGWPVLLSGMGPRLTSKVLANAIQFASFDFSQRLLGARD